MKNPSEKFWRETTRAQFDAARAALTALEKAEVGLMRDLEGPGQLPAELAWHTATATLSVALCNIRF